MAQVYVWDEFTLEKLKKVVWEAKTLDDLKSAVVDILDELPAEYAG